MKERIANLCFLRNRLRARRDGLLRTSEGAEMAKVVVQLKIVERNLDELRRARVDDSISGMRRPA